MRTIVRKYRRNGHRATVRIVDPAKLEAQRRRKAALSTEQRKTLDKIKNPPTTRPMRVWTVPRCIRCAICNEMIWKGQLAAKPKAAKLAHLDCVKKSK